MCNSVHTLYDAVKGGSPWHLRQGITAIPHYLGFEICFSGLYRSDHTADVSGHKDYESCMMPGTLHIRIRLEVDWISDDNSHILRSFSFLSSVSAGPSRYLSSLQLFWMISDIRQMPDSLAKSKFLTYAAMSSTIVFDNQRTRIFIKKV